MALRNCGAGMRALAATLVPASVKLPTPRARSKLNRQDAESAKPDLIMKCALDLTASGVLAVQFLESSAEQATLDALNRRPESQPPART
jgi:hypothetical protein